MKKIYADILSMQVIPNVDAGLAKKFNLKPEHRSLGMFTTTIDDVGYTALMKRRKMQTLKLFMQKVFTLAQHIHRVLYRVNLSES